MIFEQLTEMKGFTHQEQAVDRYILEHTEAILPMSAEELAKASYTSKATVIRLSKKLGLAGYQELKFQIVSESVQNIRINQLLQNEPINEKSTYQDVLNVIPALYDKAISDTRMCMDKNVVNRIFNRMMRADQIDFYGNGITYTLAQSAAFKFSTLGMECHARESVNAHYLTERQDQKRIAFVMSFTGANRSMIDVARYLKKTTKTFVTGIVGRHNADIREYCDEIIEIPSRDSLLSLKVMTSYTAVTYVLDVLFGMCLSQNYGNHVEAALKMVNRESLRTTVDYWNLIYNKEKKS